MGTLCREGKPKTGAVPAMPEGAASTPLLTTIVSPSCLFYPLVFSCVCVWLSWNGKFCSACFAVVGMVFLVLGKSPVWGRSVGTADVGGSGGLAERLLPK